MIDLTDLDVFANGFPHEAFVRLRREHPVWWHPATPRAPGGEGFWCLTRHADLVLAATQPEVFSSEGGGAREGGGSTLEDFPRGYVVGVMLNMMDDPRHQRVRKLVLPALAPRVLRRMEADLRERASAILDAVTPAGTCDFLVEVAAELPLQAIAILMGVPLEDRGRLFCWANAINDYGEGSRTAAAEMTTYGLALLQAKRADPSDDILSRMVHAKVPDGAGGDTPLTPMEQLMAFHLLIAAGSETTRNAIALGLAALVEHPAEQAALRADTGLVETAVEEILRWSSSTTYNRRTATRDVELRGQRVAAGDKVVLWWASANRDEGVFPDPFRFDVRRRPNPHLAFGHGNHFCLGAALARLEIRILLEEVLGRWDGIELAGPLEWVRSNKHTGLRHMPVRFRPRDRNQG